MRRRVPRLDFEAAVMSTGIDDQSLVGLGKQKEPETKENDHGRYVAIATTPRETRYSTVSTPGSSGDVPTDVENVRQALPTWSR